MQLQLYLDYLSTTPVDPGVVSAMQGCLGLSDVYGNPASLTHAYGYEAKALVDAARMQVAVTIGADPREIIWTSGATEANNLALQGTALFYQRQGKHLISVQTEHLSVLDTLKFLESQGFSLTLLKPNPDGLVDLETIRLAIRPDTILISMMQVNNETGVIQDVAAVGALARQHGIKYHVDAAQSVGKVPLDVKAISADLVSLCAHKAYGPKGVGALYVCRHPRTRLQPLLYGGGHEQGLRSGTIPTHQVVGMGVAFSIANKNRLSEYDQITALRDRFWHGIESLGGVWQNGSSVCRIPHCLNLRFEGIDGEALLVGLESLAISTGSACNAASPEPSHVLLAMGLTRTQANNSLRFSFGRYTTQTDIDHAIECVCREVKRLRAVSTGWKRHGALS